MGNCLEMSRNMRSEEEKPQREKMKRISGVKRRIKVVLTKEELEWLLIQLQDKRKLEDVLGEIERCRGKIVQPPWKPSLQTVMEICPEAQMEMER